MTRIPIVDEQDEIIGFKERDDLTDFDIRRITVLHIFNSKGEVLIAQRQFTKKIDPGKWGPSVAGTVEEGETYESNVIKEAFEELGIKNVKPIFVLKRFTELPANQRRFSAVYFMITDLSIDSFILEDDEVAAIKWIPLPELIKWYEKEPEIFLASFPRVLDDCMMVLNGSY